MSQLVDFLSWALTSWFPVSASLSHVFIHFITLVIILFFLFFGIIFDEDLSKVSVPADSTQSWSLSLLPSCLLFICHPSPFSIHVLQRALGTVV